MLVVFTGNGKGKTTAAIGAAVRAVGRGRRVLMVQFIKGPWASGEDFIDVVQKVGPTSPKASQGRVSSGSFTLKKLGLGFVGILGDQLSFEEHCRAAQKALDFVRAEITKSKSQNSNEDRGYDMFILDEVNVAVQLKLVTAAEVLDLLKNIPDEKIVVLTGRDAPQEFIDAADLATEMKEVKHPFNSGKLGKLNVEF